MRVVLPKKWKNDYWSRAMLLSIGYLKSIKEDSSRRFTSVHDGPNRCLSRAHFNDPGARDSARETRCFGICSSAGTSPCLHHLRGTQHETSFCLLLQRQLVPKKTLVDNFKRAIMEAKHVNEFRPDDVLWEKISKGLLKNPDRPLKNTDKRMVYIYNDMFFVKKDFTFGFRTVKPGEIHLIQTTNVPILIYEFPSSSLRCRTNFNLLRGALSHMIRCSIIEWCWNPTRRTRSRL
ncbi:hypothetical protein TNCV_686541 [Trichonephila clavipes]|nr:hypothetical protein TNCV_686541 [Trichonephila clavipes]